MTPDSPTADVVIVGAGPLGMAIAYAFTQRGMRDVMVCATGDEPATALGPLGPPGGPGPGGGAVYCPVIAPALAAMAAAGIHLFENAFDELGEDVGFRRCGRLVGGHAAGPDAPTTPATLAAPAAPAAPDTPDTPKAPKIPENLELSDPGIRMRRALGIDIRRVSAEAARTYWPELPGAARTGPAAPTGGEVRTDGTDGPTAFIHEPGAGYADTRRTARAFARAARRGGAAILPGAPAVGLSVRRDRIVGVRLGDGREVACGTVVVAAGVDAPAFVAPLGVRLPLRAAREFAVLVRVDRALGARPILVDPIGRWSRPDGPDRLLVGIPDPGPFGADPAAHALAHLAARLPGLPEPVPEAVFAIRCDVGPDHLPLLGSTGPDGLFVAAGCAEHGLGVVPAVGMLVADLLCDGASGRPDIPGTDFRPDRFPAPPHPPVPHAPGPRHRPPGSDAAVPEPDGNRLLSSDQA